MTGLQALITGAIAGALQAQHWLEVDVEPQVDGEGNYEPWFRVTGRQSGASVIVRVEVVG